MDDLYAKIVRERGSVERLMARIPGFRGYMEMNARRQADRLLRDHIAALLKAQINRLAEAEKLLLETGGLSYMSQTRSAKTKFQTYIDRIATDVPGYSGFFDAVKIGEDDLAVIYAFDEALLDYVEKFTQAIDVLYQAATTGEGVQEAIRALDALAIEANQAYSLRDQVLNGIA
jgi:hypothetical protein